MLEIQIILQKILQIDNVVSEKILQIADVISDYW